MDELSLRCLIASWAADQMMTRVAHRVYSLLGLLDVNVLIGCLRRERKKVFYHPQLEDIHVSNNHSIFA